MINSTANRQVRQVVNLVKKAKARREEDLYVVEGIRMFSELSPQETQGVYVTRSFLQEEGHRALLEAFGYELVSDQVMEAMAGTKTPQGIMAVARQRHYELSELLNGSGFGAPALLMFLETLQDPGNLGTILRAGEGAGITGVIMDRATVDIYNPKVIRSTMGSILRVPFVYAENLEEACSRARSAGVRLYAALLDQAVSYDREDYRSAAGFLIGNEAAGLSPKLSALADCRVKIPMAGQVESLNAAVAAAVLMFEASRQRRGAENPENSAGER